MTETKTKQNCFPLFIPDKPNFFYDVKISFPPPSFFQKNIVHPAIIIPSKRTAELRRSLNSILMHRPKVKMCIQSHLRKQSMG